MMTLSVFEGDFPITNLLMSDFIVFLARRVVPLHPQSFLLWHTKGARM